MKSSLKAAHRNTASALGNTSAKVVCANRLSCGLQGNPNNQRLSEILGALGEHVGPVIDNLGRAERLGVLASADEWLAICNLRNQMVHE